MMVASNATGTYPFQRKQLELPCCPCGIHVPLANTPIVLAQNRNIHFAVAMSLQAQCQYAGQMLHSTLTPEFIQAEPQIALVLSQRLTTCVELLHCRRSAEYHLSYEFCLRHLLDGLHVSMRSCNRACPGVILDAHSKHVVCFGTLPAQCWLHMSANAWCCAVPDTVPTCIVWSSCLPQTKHQASAHTCSPLQSAH